MHPLLTYLCKPFYVTHEFESRGVRNITPINPHGPPTLCCGEHVNTSHSQRLTCEGHGVVFYIRNRTEQERTNTYQTSSSAVCRAVLVPKSATSSSLLPPRWTCGAGVCYAFSRHEDYSTSHLGACRFRRSTTML